MHNLFWKHFHLCCFKFKYPITNLSEPLNPKQQYHTHSSNSVPLNSSSTSIIINNFNQHSLYDTSSSDSDFFTSSDNNSDSWDPPDLATVFASKRFFFSSPGSSNSIIESPETRPLLDQYTTNNNISSGSSSSSSNNSNTLVIPTGGIKVPKYSINPYSDFRRSMQEMVESREVTVDVKNDWEYLHELLLCYLALNPTNTHKYIVRAFTDLVVSMLSSSSSSSSSTPATKRQCSN